MPPAGAKRLLTIAVDLAILEYTANGWMDDSAREHIQNRLQSAENVWGIIPECRTFGYFVRHGATVEPRFLINSSRDEIIVHWSGHNIPVQCKSKKPGAGRVISQDSFINLAGCVARDAARSHPTPILVRVWTTGKIRQGDIEFLRDRILNQIGSSSGPELHSNQGRSFVVTTEIKAEWRSLKLNPSQVQEFISRFDSYHKFVITEPFSNNQCHKPIVVVTIESDPVEKPWNSLNESINAAKRQLKDGPPGIISIHYADPVEDFESIRYGNEPMLLALARKFHKLPYVAGVMLSAEPDLQRPDARGVGPLRTYFQQERLPPKFPMGSLV